MLDRDTNKSGFKSKLSVMDASAMYNVHGGASVCWCKGDCGVNSRCTCKVPQGKGQGKHHKGIMVLQEKKDKNI